MSIVRVGCFLSVVALVLAGTSVAQERPPAAKPREDVQKVTGLSAQEMRGEREFVDRCALCHFPKQFKECCLSPIGTDLSRVLQGPDPEGAKEEYARNQITRGSANMPGFQALTPGELDDIIAYLKIINRVYAFYDSVKLKDYHFKN